MATLATYEGMFGPYHTQTLALTTALAVALCASGRREDGRRLLERAVWDLTKHHGRRHPARIRALEALYALLSQEGDRRGGVDGAAGTGRLPYSPADQRATGFLNFS